MEEDFKKKVELIATLENTKTQWDCEDSASCGARGCFDEKSSKQIHEDEISRPKNEYEDRKEKIFSETSGRGHGAVLDQSEFSFSIDNLTRASTLFLCSPQYASHLQQSLRRATAERGFYIPESLKETPAEEIMKREFDLYSRMQSSGIPSEDARFILPLYTKTTIQTKMDARELMHLHSMSKRGNVPSEVVDTVSQMVSLASKKAPRLMKDRGTNYEILSWMPAPQLFQGSNRTIEDLINGFSVNSEEPGKTVLIDHAGIHMSPDSIRKAVKERDESELANMKHYHFTFLSPMSIATFHQATRQRTWDQSVEALNDAVKRGKYVTPKSIVGTEFEGEYREINRSAMDIANFHSWDRESIGIIPHSVRIYDLIHVNGWNAVHSIGKRTCTEAQWEIRNIAREMSSYIQEVSPELGKYSVPQGIIYGKCPERKPCGICKRKE